MVYPNFIKDVSGKQIRLTDESFLNFNLEQNNLKSLANINNLSDIDRTISDLSRIRVHSLLRYMYGETEEQVKRNLVEIYWLPKTLNKKILITSINDVNKNLQKISDELDKLPKSLKKYITKLSGTFHWRKIQDSDELSTHSYGIAVDINKKYGNYWKWDLNKGEDLNSRNKIPYQIVRVFEQHGFIWGGRWASYDTMHFEYRPEFLIDRKKRILILSRGGVNYGSEIQLSRLINNIDQSKYELHLITTEKCSSNFSIYSKSIFDLPAWGKLKNLISKYRAAARLLNYAQQENIDLIHCSYQWLYPYARFVGKKLNIPVLLHIRRPNNKTKLIKRYSSADRVICISKRIFQEFLTSGYNNDRLLLIPDAISDSFKINICKNELKTKLDLNKKFVIAIIGRIYENKKHHLFIELASLLSQSHDEIEFLIVGKVDDCNYYENIKNLARLSNAKITFTGHEEDMDSIFNAIDILISFSGGSVMYEAMAWGKVVVSIGFVNQSTSTYLIDRKNALVIEGNSLELARDKIIDILLDDKLFGSISHEASILVKQNLLPKITSKQVESVYESF